MMKVIFICTGNSCRSQMAEGIAQERFGDSVIALSAGLRPEENVHPLAVEVMKEIGIDISRQKPKIIDPDILLQMDCVVTLCGDGEESCPATPPSIKRVHMPVNDPSKSRGSEEEVAAAFRNARREVEEKVSAVISDLLEKNNQE